MSYVGSAPSPSQVQFSTLDAQSFNGDGSTTAFTLNRAVSIAASIEVTVNNVQQSPYDGSYTVNGTTTLTFSEAPSSGTDNIYVRFLDYPLASITPADGSVTAASLASGLAFSQWTTTGSNIYYNTGSVGIGTTTSLSRLTALGTSSTVANGASTRNPITSIRGGNDNNRLDVYVDNSGATAIMGLGAYNTAGGATAMAFYTGASVDERMRIDSAGRVTMPYQPAFLAGSTWLNVTTTAGQVIGYDAAVTNIGGHYNTSSYRFTAPVSGMYMFGYWVYRNSSSVSHSISIYKNGTQSAQTRNYQVSSDQSWTGTMAVYLTANDYVDVRTDDAFTNIYGNYNSSGTRFAGFYGYLIG